MTVDEAIEIKERKGEEFRETPLPLREIRVWGKVATLTPAKKNHECAASGLPIEKGEDYYCVYICSAGMRDTKSPPARVRVECIHDYLNFGGKLRR